MFVCSQVYFAVRSFEGFMMRIYVCFLLLLIAGAASAAVHCDPQPDGSWICSGYGDELPPPFIVVSNFWGVCTNCTGMAPEKCTTIRSTLDSKLKESIYSLDYIDQMADLGLADIRAFDQKWEQSVIITDWPSASADVIQAIDDNGLWGIVVTQTGNNSSTSGSALTGYKGGNNSIVNFYHEVVHPFLGDLKSRFEAFPQETSKIKDSLISLYGTVQEIDCSQCKATPNAAGDPAYPGGGGSDGGGSGGGGSGCGECCDHGPMLEQMQGLQEAVDRIEVHVGGISNSVVSIERQFKDYSKKILAALSAISNSVFRLDSYVTGDLKSSVESITNSLLVVERNIDGVQRDFYQAMSNAQYFVSQGGKEWDPSAISTNFFEVGEYKDLPWASRVEALLLKISNPFGSDSDSPSVLTNSVMDDVKEQSDLLKEALDTSSMSSEYRQALNRVKTAFSSFNGFFQGGANSVISFGPIGDFEFSFSIDSSIATACHTVFSLIWYASSLVALFFIVPFLWSLSLGSFKFLWQLLTLLVK